MLNESPNLFLTFLSHTATALGTINRHRHEHTHTDRWFPSLFANLLKPPALHTNENTATQYHSKRTSQIFITESSLCLFFLLLPLCATAIVIDHYRQRQQRYALRFYIVPTAMGVLESIVAVASSLHILEKGHEWSFLCYGFISSELLDNGKSRGINTAQRRLISCTVNNFQKRCVLPFLSNNDCEWIHM